MEKVTKKNKEVTFIITKTFDITEFSESIMSNVVPGAISSFRCESWDYENMEFVFTELIDPKVHTLKRDDIEKGFEKFINLCLEGSFWDPNLSNPSFLLDECYWDAEIVDMAVQVCILGDVIY